ncbi:Crp/Fnr family transcriptional regulator [Vibrio sp. LaRot3]|uniref:Crp/Fnr family transcriptional regulator n=1 Tax=Vibrio sp. LaRot3 TaxID=2998829 RepID=UPI0022CE0F6D|nr:Crp/Fnr family transcriptional regulator [Vibrio sp. LaRot3]MDA0149516.1 Crp/Fnr family transcriptional regulator [Vibrio sp. LaRot3]
MDATFIQHLEEHGFNTEEIEQINQYATELQLPTRQILVEQGGSAQSIYFIVHGLCQASYLTEEGKSFSKEFYWEQDWILSLEAVIKQQGSPYLIETLTDCHIICLPIDVLKRWRAESHPIYLKLVETQLIYKEQKERFMLLYTPEQRYELFCQQFPDLEQRLNDYHIAAYLGISSISLSRIKSRINKG